MTATARKPNWRTLCPKFMCGHVKADNTLSNGGCRVCHNDRERRRQRRIRAAARRHAPPLAPPVAVPALDVPASVERHRKPMIPLTYRTLQLIESCRAEYECAIGQLELFASKKPFSHTLEVSP